MIVACVKGKMEEVEAGEFSSEQAVQRHIDNLHIMFWTFSYPLGGVLLENKYQKNDMAKFVNMFYPTIFHLLLQYV